METIRSMSGPSPVKDGLGWPARRLVVLRLGNALCLDDEFPEAQFFHSLSAWPHLYDLAVTRGVSVAGEFFSAVPPKLCKQLTRLRIGHPGEQVFPHRSIFARSAPHLRELEVYFEATHIRDIGGHGEPKTQIWPTTLFGPPGNASLLPVLETLSVGWRVPGMDMALVAALLAALPATMRDLRVIAAPDVRKGRAAGGTQAPVDVAFELLRTLGLGLVDPACVPRLGRMAVDLVGFARGQISHDMISDCDDAINLSDICAARGIVHEVRGNFH